MVTISQQTIHSGCVVMARFEADGSRGFGFIRRSNGGNDVHFGCLAAEGRVLKIRDRVEFLEYEQRPDRAFRVWKVGEDETS